MTHTRSEQKLIPHYQEVIKVPEEFDPVAENEKAEREWYERSASKELWKPTRTLLIDWSFHVLDGVDSRFRVIYSLLALNAVATVLCFILWLLK